MSYLPPDHDFRKHSANLRAVTSGLTQAERAHKTAIRNGDEAATEFAARMHQIMVGLLAEAYLRKIVCDPDGFNPKEQKLLSRERSQLDRWLRVVEFAFRRHYSVPLHLEITGVTTSSASAPSQYAAISDLLQNDLNEVIQDRNKLAHSQWAWILNKYETVFVGPGRPPLNYLASYRRSLVIKYVAQLIHVLVVSEPTFQRDYTNAYQAIIATRASINGADYPTYVAELRARSAQHRRS